MRHAVEALRARARAEGGGQRCVTDMDAPGNALKLSSTAKV